MADGVGRTMADGAARRPYQDSPPLDRNRNCDYGEHEHEPGMKRHRKRLSILAVGLALIVSVAFGANWTVIRQRDRPYVTFANVAQFYQFPDYTRASRTVSLRSERRVIRARRARMS